MVAKSEDINSFQALRIVHVVFWLPNSLPCRPTDTEARIVKIKANGFIVFVPKYGSLPSNFLCGLNIMHSSFLLLSLIRFGIEGPIYLTPKGDKGGDWVVDEVHQRVTKPGTNISYAILQTVRIHMEVVEPQPHRPKLQLTLIWKMYSWIVAALECFPGPLTPPAHSLVQHWCDFRFVKLTSNHHMVKIL